MAHRIDALIDEVSVARERFLAAVGIPTSEQAALRPRDGSWCVTEIVEHMTLAERSGVFGMWKAVEGVRSGRPVWSGDPVHRGKPVEAIIAATWREREDVPAIAAPSWGGPLGYWVTALRGGASALAALGEELKSLEREGHRLEDVIYPHPISGPMDVWQRLEFLRFHLDRHAGQVRNVWAAIEATSGT